MERIGRRFLIFVLPALVCCGRGSILADQSNWVRQLGSPSFQTRIEAERLILEAGSRMLPSLQEGLRSKDTEIRLRSLRLYSQLWKTSCVEDQSLIFRSPWNAPEHLTPGWDVFHELLGDGAASRKLYVDLLLEESSLMFRLVLQPHNWMTDYERRCEELRTYFEYQNSDHVTPATVAALIFLGLHPENQPSPVAVNLVNSLIDDAQFRNSVQHGETGGPLKDLVRHWIRDPGKGSPSQRLTLAGRFDVGEALSAARETIAARHLETSPMGTLQDAFIYLARHGGYDAIEELEALLEDEMSLQRPRGGKGNSSMSDFQVRDAALFALLIITRQEPLAYGFQNVRGDLITPISLKGATMPDDSTRQAAHQKWRAWRGQYLPRIFVPEDASDGSVLSFVAGSGRSKIPDDSQGDGPSPQHRH